MRYAVVIEKAETTFRLMCRTCRAVLLPERAWKPSNTKSVMRSAFISPA